MEGPDRATDRVQGRRALVMLLVLPVLVLVFALACVAVGYVAGE